MQSLQVLRTLIVLTLILINMACDSSQHKLTSWYEAVYQNPSKVYLDTLNSSEWPRKRLYCFIETVSLDSVQHSLFRLLSPVISGSLELVLVPKESMGFVSGKNRKRYIVATRYLENEAMIERMIEQLKKSYIIRTTNLSIDTIVFSGDHYKMVNELSVDYAKKVLASPVINNP